MVALRNDRYETMKILVQAGADLNRKDEVRIREYGSTLYVGMTRGKNGGRIKRVH